MTWREDLRRVTIAGKTLIGASFRGVPFLVEASERGGGRRTVTHEFPLSDDPFVEDLGRSARTFRVDGYVIGDDYLSQRDTLLTALEDTEGPGELVEPFYGVKVVICKSVQVRSTRDEGGIAMFAIEFAETPTQSPAPSIAVDSVGQVGDAADAAATATDSAFTGAYSSDGLPSFALDSAQTALVNATNAVRDDLAPIITDTQELAQLNSQATIIVAEASSLVRTPAIVIDQFRTMITSLINTTASAPGDVMNALFTAYAADLGPVVTAITATRAKELANQTALTSALRRAMAVEAARIAPTVPYATIDAALAARNQIAAILDEQAGLADDTAYPAIVELRSQVLRAVPGSSSFARVVTITRKVAIPSLVLAYQLYGSVDLEADVIARNNVRNPGFIFGDQIKVLSSDG